MTFKYKQPVLRLVRECHCEAEGRGNLDPSDCFTSFATTDSHRCYGSRGLTLLEMTVVISIAALMVGLTLPAANMLFNSFETESGAKSIVSAALASARAIAAKEQRYAGIRFQKRYDPNNPDPLNASQYIIFVIHDPNLSAGWGDFFRAVEGFQPIKLPDSVGAVDMLYSSSLNSGNPDTDYVNSNVLRDTTTFSIVFSPAGKLVIRDIRVRNRNGKRDSDVENSNDDIFNKLAAVQSGVAMFPQDDYFASPTNLGLGLEPSRNSFCIYETKRLKQTDQNLRWTNYLSLLNRFYINPYTGTIINEQ
jgi:type II secretory pathway pseudopilin PulG